VSTQPANDAASHAPMPECASLPSAPPFVSSSEKRNHFRGKRNVN